MASGGLLLEIPKAQATSQADALANHLKELFPEGTGMRMFHPVRKVDLRLTGFDDSVTPKEIPGDLELRRRMQHGSGTSRGNPHIL